MVRLQRRLWMALAAFVALGHVMMVGLTQNSPSLTLLAGLLWCGALICIEDQLPDLRLTPSGFSLMLGSALVLAGLWRTASIYHLDVAALFLPPVFGIGLALLWKPCRQLAQQSSPLLVLLLFPLSVLLTRLLPEMRLSLLTARLTQIVLLLAGSDVRVNGRDVLLPGGGVSVNHLCAGIDLIAQLIAIAIVFVLAFPLPKRRSRLLMLLIAPCIAIAGNTLRIALLAVISASQWPGKAWWFNFFHESDGSFLFAGLTVSVFGWLYLVVLNRQLNQLEDRAALASASAVVDHGD